MTTPTCPTHGTRHVVATYKGREIGRYCPTCMAESGRAVCDDFTPDSGGAQHWCKRCGWLRSYHPAKENDR